MIQIMKDEGLTVFGQENRENIGEIATIIFENFKKKRGKHILKFFIEDFNFDNLTKSDFILLEQFFPKKEIFLDNKELYEYKEKGRVEKYVQR